jgi:hypothetical protein
MPSKRYSFSFVEAGSRDYEEALALRFRIFYEPHNLPKDIVADELENRSIHLTASFAKQLVGYGRLTLTQKVAQISQMVVEPSHQGKGVGSLMMKMLFTKPVESGATMIFLDARLPPIPFYERFGFKRVGSDFPSKKTGLPHHRMERLIENQHKS